MDLGHGAGNAPVGAHLAPEGDEALPGVLEHARGIRGIVALSHGVHSSFANAAFGRPIITRPGRRGIRAMLRQRPGPILAGRGSDPIYTAEPCRPTER